jgi:hypothetical protein
MHCSTQPHGIDPFERLRDVLARLPNHYANRLAERIHHRWVQPRSVQTSTLHLAGRTPKSGPAVLANLPRRYEMAPQHSLFIHRRVAEGNAGYVSQPRDRRGHSSAPFLVAKFKSAKIGLASDDRSLPTSVGINVLPTHKIRRRVPCDPAGRVNYGGALRQMVISIGRTEKSGVV